jgi:predicted nucleic acid-binding protein
MLPLRLVIDTNVLISAALKPGGLQRTTFLLAITKPGRLYVTRPILEEYADVLCRPELRIRKGVTPAAAAAHQEQQPHRRTLTPPGRVQ